jgi:hypothetical protein
MIIANVIGGLGNQMFQYAAARSLSLQLEQPLRLDISMFDGYSLHQGFELERVFTCEIKTATEKDIRAILAWQSAPLIRRILQRPRMAFLRNPKLVVEPRFSYWPEFRFIARNSYLVGYWQSEKYFKSIATTIREDYNYKQPIDIHNAKWVAKIGEVNSVSMHVRRGDYVSDPRANATHGLCSLEYYRAAIRHVADRVADPHFFIFSDDMEWVRENMKVDYPCEYVSHNDGAESYRDMQLMSTCQHHIIANSSFSWWGAWLNPREDKIVVAPERWFPDQQRQTDDLIPPQWYRL